MMTSEDDSVGRMVRWVLVNHGRQDVAEALYDVVYCMRAPVLTPVFIKCSLLYGYTSDLGIIRTLEISIAEVW